MQESFCGGAGVGCCWPCDEDQIYAKNFEALR
jgi:hypothetical protein